MSSPAAFARRFQVLVGVLKIIPQGGSAEPIARVPPEGNRARVAPEGNKVRVPRE